jgi:putative addiction module component (TIGR02574 family)
VADPMSELDDAFNAAESLEPDDRLRLIARLWASLPAEHWAAPGEEELRQIERQLNDFDTDRLAEVPWKIVRQIASERWHSLPPPKLYSAPRRFDLATIFVVTAAYAIILSSLRGLGSPPLVVFYIAGFITLVGIGQAVLFGGTKPRLASVLTGIVAYFVGMVTAPLVGHFDIGGAVEQVAVALLFAAPVGAPLGYVAGVIVGGVFLVADAIRQMHTRPADVENAPSDDGAVLTH